MTCKKCLMFGHCRYDIDREGEPCENFKNKDDVVEVVRCKDCIHYYELEPVCLKIYSDGNVSADAWQERKPNDFCSYGIAKMDEKGEG